MYSLIKSYFLFIQLNINLNNMSLFFNITTKDKITSFEWCRIEFIEIANIAKSSIKSGNSQELMEIIKQSHTLISCNIHARIEKLFAKYAYKEKKSLIEMKMEQNESFYDSCINYISDHTRGLIEDIPDILRDMIHVYMSRDNINCFTVPKCGKSTYSLLLYSYLPLKTIIFTDDEKLQEKYNSTKDIYDSMYNMNLKIVYNRVCEITDEKIVIFDNIKPFETQIQTIIFNNEKHIENNFILNISYGLSCEIINVINALELSSIKNVNTEYGKLPIFIHTNDIDYYKNLCEENILSRDYAIIEIENSFDLKSCTKANEVLIFLSKKSIYDLNVNVELLKMYMHIFNGPRY